MPSYHSNKRSRVEEGDDEQQQQELHSDSHEAQAQARPWKNPRVEPQRSPESQVRSQDWPNIPVDGLDRIDIVEGESEYVSKDQNGCIAGASGHPRDPPGDNNHGIPTSAPADASQAAAMDKTDADLATSDSTSSPAVLLNPNTFGEAQAALETAGASLASIAAPVVSDATGTEEAKTKEGLEEGEIAEEEVPKEEDEGPSTLSPVEQLCSDLENELTCCICSALLYNPVTVAQCSHAFCGSCLTLFIRSMQPPPHTCPACRNPAQTAHHSRPLASLVQVLLTHCPERTRTAAERQQADEVWVPSASTVIKFPQPAPKVRVETYRPCLYCYNNTFSDEDGGQVWRCPIPVPSADSDNAYPLDGPCPEGHFQCSGCSRLTNSEAPRTQSCGICQDGYCGLEGCAVCTLSTARLGGAWSNLADAVQDPPSDELLLAFHDNMEELKILSDYISQHPDITSQYILRRIFEWLSSPEGIDQGGVKGLFMRVDSGIHGNLNLGAVVERACRACVTDIFCCGLYEWWFRERKAIWESLPKSIQVREDCKNGSRCYRQSNRAHIQKFNHICAPLPADLIDTVYQDDVPRPVTARFTQLLHNLPKPEGNLLHFSPSNTSSSPASTATSYHTALSTRTPSFGSIVGGGLGYSSLGGDATSSAPAWRDGSITPTKLPTTSAAGPSNWFTTVNSSSPNSSLSSSSKPIALSQNPTGDFASPSCASIASSSSYATANSTPTQLTIPTSNSTAAGNSSSSSPSSASSFHRHATLFSFSQSNIFSNRTVNLGSAATGSTNEDDLENLVQCKDVLGGEVETDDEIAGDNEKLGHRVVVQ